MRSRVSTLEASNRDTLALLESKSKAHDNLAEDLATQHQKTLDLRREITSLEKTVQELNSAASANRFKEQHLQQEIELLQKNNDWFDTELKTKNAEYLKFRKEKSARISELQQQNEEVNTRVETLQRTENSLRSGLDDLQQKFTDSQATIQQLREEIVQNHDSFRIELDSASRLAKLHQNAAESAKARVQDLQLSLQQVRDEASDELGRLRAELETEHTDKETAEERCAELEATVEQLQAQGVRNRSMSPARSVNGNGPSTPVRSGTPVSTFSPRSAKGKGGLTVTKMYEEYDRMRIALSSEQRTSQELRTTLDEMLQEMESRKPEIDELQSELTRLQSGMNDMSKMLESAGKARDGAVKEARKWQGQVSGLTREGEILRQQLRDLSAQIKVLLMEQHLRDQGESNYDRMDLERVARGEIDDMAMEGMSDTQKLISENLTTFKNIDELQEKNVTALRMLRELGEQMESQEAREKQKIQEAEHAELEELRVKVQTYKDEISSLLLQTKSYIKERDTFRNMLTRRGQFGESQGPGSPRTPGRNIMDTVEATPSKDNSESLEVLRKIQAQFDAYRQESAIDQTSLKQQITELSKKNGDLQNELSRTASQLTTTISRGELSQRNYDMLKAENAELQKRSMQLMENLNKSELRTQQAAEDLVANNGLLDSLRRESANLKAEKQLWSNIEARLVEDNNSLRNERSRLDNMAVSLQNLLNEREHAEAETRRRLTASVDSLEAELQSTKRKLNDETEESRKARLQREYEHEQSQKRIDDLVASLSSVREELAAAKTSRDHLQARVDEMTVELRSAEERLEVLHPKPTADAAPAENQPTDENSLTREQELAVEVSELKRDLELAKTELEHAEEQVEDYKSISQGAEERLQELVETNDQYKEETDSLIAEKDAKIADLEQRIEDITSELSTTNTELSQLRDEQAESGRRLDEQKTGFETEINRLKEDVERHLAAAAFHQSDLKAQAEIAQQAHQNYESELVKHAEAAKALQLVRKEANDIKTEIAEWKAKAESAETALVQKEDSWTEMKSRYEREVEDLKKRREEVAAQNNILHQQLENITKQIAELQQTRAANENEDNDEEATGTNPDLENLQEVIRYLRREKEIVDVQYHMSTQEAKRLQQQLTYTQSELDQTRLKLEQQRRADADNENNTLNHNKLMDTLNELNVFRESSVTLRSQARQAEAALAEQSKKVEELTAQLEPLQTRIGELENICETKDGEMKLLQDDRDRWQQRTQNILQKYDRVDPAEMEALKENLATLEKERDEAVSVKASLEEQVATIPDQLKQAEERLTDMRARLTEQFKARSKELTGRIAAKQSEVNTALAEKDQIAAELTQVKTELEETKASLAAAQTAAPTEAATTAPAEQAPASDNADVQALQQKIQQLEAALAEKQKEFDAKVGQMTQELIDKTVASQEAAAAKQAAHQEELAQLRAGQTAAPEDGEVSSQPTPSLFSDLDENGLPKLSLEQARALCQKNAHINTILRNSIKNNVEKNVEKAKAASLQEIGSLREQLEKLQNSQVAAAAQNGDAPVEAPSKPDPTPTPATTSDANIQELQQKFEAEKAAIIQDLQHKSQQEREAAVAACEAKFEEEKQAILAEQQKKIDSAIELTEKRVSVKLSMAEGRERNATAKLKVVEEAVKTTPEKAVVEVWKVVVVTKAPPPVARAPVAAAKPAPAQAAPAPSANGAPQTPVQQVAPSPAPVQAQPQQIPQPQIQSRPGSAMGGAISQAGRSALPVPGQQQHQLPQPVRPGSSLGNHPNAGNQGVLRGLQQSGLPLARGGARSVSRGGAAVAGATDATAAQQAAAGSQLPTTRGSGLPRGGARGARGGAQGRGGAQASAIPAPGGAAQQAAQQAGSPGRGGLNINARQFVPGGKRAREDGGEAAAGETKRARGGGAGARGGANA